jgi:sodium/hydrogen exchanger-like protein 6/7/sodium/hydrogen exchanger 8
MISFESEPKVYSMVFGEGIINDAVSIILFNSVKTYSHVELTVEVPFKILGSFLLLAVASVGIGIAVGLIASVLLKHMRFISASSIRESLFIFCFGYISYAIGYITNMSGIISLLMSGVVMAHYGWYNLSP